VDKDTSGGEYNTSNPSLTVPLDAEALLFILFQECIEMDNAAFGNALASQIQHDHERETIPAANDVETTMSEDTVVPQSELQ
jgi:hypothetical protein